MIVAAIKRGSRLTAIEVQPLVVLAAILLPAAKAKCRSRHIKRNTCVGLVKKTKRYWLPGASSGDTTTIYDKAGDAACRKPNQNRINANRRFMAIVSYGVAVRGRPNTTAKYYGQILRPNTFGEYTRSWTGYLKN